MLITGLALLHVIFRSVNPIIMKSQCCYYTFIWESDLWRTWFWLIPLQHTLCVVLQQATIPQTSARFDHTDVTPRDVTILKQKHDVQVSSGNTLGL